jgi:SSS family solute:Na+ symporter
VYSLTARPREGHLPFYQRPLTLGIVVLVLVLLLNLIFW